MSFGGCAVDGMLMVVCGLQMNCWVDCFHPLTGFDVTYFATAQWACACSWDYLKVVARAAEVAVVAVLERLIWRLLRLLPAHPMTLCLMDR